MIKLIATDLDETLLSSQKTIDPKNIAALKKANEMGIIIAIATGRGPYQLLNVLEEIDNIRKDRFSILCNGGIIMRNSDRKIVHSSAIAFEKAKGIYEFCKKQKIYCEIYTDKHCYVANNGKEETHVNYKNSTYQALTDESLDFLKDEIIVKVLLRSYDLNYLMALEEDIAKICNWEISISYSSDMFMEINEKGTNKAIALKKLCTHYGIGMDEILAIGDNFNDQQMLEEAGISVAVKNAHLLLKDIADYTSTKTNDQAAVADAIERFVLNK